MQAPSPIRAVTFDVGGTLIEPWPSVGHVYAEVAAQHGFGGLRPEELSRRFVRAWKVKAGFDYSPGAWERLVDATFLGLVEPPPSRSFFAQLYERFNHPAAWRVYDDVGPTLTRLQRSGLRLAIISNWDDRLRPLLARLGLAPCFAGMAISIEVGQVKPAPAIFQHAAELLAAAPGEILHIGDSRLEDVEGARAAGFRGLLLNRTGSAEAPGCICRLSELEI